MPTFRWNATTNNASIGDHVSQKLTFWGMVGVVMAALKLKERMDDYNQIPSEEEGRVRLPGSPLPGDDDDISMMDTQIPGAARARRPKRRGCCVCCGLDCTLFWKAFGIVVLLFTLWNGFKLVRWATTASPTGLEAMPEFSSSLGCASAPHIFNGAKTDYQIPVGASKTEHVFDIRGTAVGTVTLVEAASDAVDITASLTIRTDTESLLSKVSMRLPDPESAADQKSTTLTTPISLGNDVCMRYDLNLYIPPTLKSLTLSTRTVTQVQFDKDSHINLDKLVVKMYSRKDTNMILPSVGVQAISLELIAGGGWIVGDVSIVNTTSIITNSGSSTTNIHVHPVTSAEGQEVHPAFLTTTTGSGRSDVFYENDATAPHRQIVSSHIAAKAGDLYLTYKNAQYTGSVDLKSKSHSAFGMHGFAGPPPIPGAPDSTEAPLPWVGTEHGSDRLVVRSPNGWVGLYF